MDENQKQEKFNQVVVAMKRSELNPRSQEHLRVFLFSIMDEPRFEKILNLMNNKPDVFDLFAKCFDLKIRFLEQTGDQADWQHLLDCEKELLMTYKKVT
jgi:hypothetical protein